MTGRITVVLFAQTPPPEHGQSRMVLLALDALRDRSDLFDVHHINARFAKSLEDIGDSSVNKIILSLKYLFQSINIRYSLHKPVLYYVPGPVKWSSVLRDWWLLLVLRIFYKRIVFHLHTIGHGEWAHGSERLALEGPQWLNRAARGISRWVLHRPFASICVSPHSLYSALRRALDPSRYGMVHTPNEV